VEPVVLAAWLTVAAGAALILKTMLSMLLTRTTFRFLAFRQASLSVQLAERFLALPLLTVQGRSSQDTAYLLTLGTKAAIVGILGATSSAVADVGLLLILALGLSAVDPTVTIFAILYFSAVTFILHRVLSRWAAKLGKQSTEADMESYTVVSEAVSTYREAFVSNRRPAYVKDFEGLRWKSAVAGADFQFVSLIPKYVSEIAIVVGGILLALVMALTRDAAAAIAILAVFLVAAARVMPALLRLQVTGIVIRQAQAAAQLVFDLARDFGGVESKPRGPDKSLSRTDFIGESSGFEGRVKVSNVSVQYPGSTYRALEDVSLEVEPGASVALVGSTGPGKSTLADVVLGVITPDAGSVSVSGLEAEEAI